MKNGDLVLAWSMDMDLEEHTVVYITSVEDQHICQTGSGDLLFYDRVREMPKSSKPHWTFETCPKIYALQNESTKDLLLPAAVVEDGVLLLDSMGDYHVVTWDVLAEKWMWVGFEDNKLRECVQGDIE